MANIKYQRGFTIVELIVVVVVIAVLAAITIVTYRGMQDRSKATAIIAGIKQVEDGFRIYMINNRLSEYPRDTTFAPGNPTLQAMGEANSAWAEDVQPSSLPSFANWYYDNDKDSADPNVCLTAGGTDWNAVSLVVTTNSRAISDNIDKAIDDGDLLCGKVRFANTAGTQITYKLSWNQRY